MPKNKKILTITELKELYYTMTNDELCKILGVTKKTLISHLIRNNIPLKGKGNPRKLIITAN